jgi:hypothetical protein
MIKRFLFIFSFLFINAFSTNHFLAFPRCGNNWMLYQMVNLTHKKCIGMGGDRFWNNGFQYRTHKNVKFADYSRNDESIVLFHYFTSSSLGFLSNQKNNEDKLILLIRDYRECLLRNYNYDINVIKKQITMWNISDLKKYKNNIEHNQIYRFNYFNNLYYFDAYQGPKLLMYYEDVIREPKKSLLKMFDFLGESTQYFNTFFNNLKYHKQKSLDLYFSHGGGSASRAKCLHYHSAKLGYLRCVELDDLVIKNHPVLWEKYLKRYDTKK